MTVYNVHVDILKMLILEGADLTETKSQETVVHRAASYMSADNFHELCRFLIEDIKAEYLFTPREYKWSSPLPVILGKQKGLAVETVKMILNIPGIDVNQSDAHGNTLFLTAIHKRQSEDIINYLSKAGADVNAVNKNGENALYLACQNENFSLIFHLLSQDIDTCQRNSEGNTFLHTLPWNFMTPEEYHNIIGQLSLTGKQAIFHITNKVQELPIHKAVEHLEIKMETLLLLMNHNVNFNATNLAGQSLLMFAVFGASCVELLSNLLKIGVDLMTQTTSGNTFLHLASKFYSGERWHDIVELIIQQGYGTAFCIQNDMGATPLHCAFLRIELLEKTCKLIYTKLVQTHQVDINCLDSIGRNLLGYAVQGKRSVNCLKLLVEMGANLFAEDINGNTMAHYMARFYSAEEYHTAVEYLIDAGHGKIFQVLSKTGSTPLHWAAFQFQLLEKTLELIKVKLVQTGIVDINCKGNEGLTILMGAAMDYSRELTITGHSPLPLINWTSPDPSFLTFKSIDGATTKAMSESKWDVKHLKALIDMGADVKIQEDIDRNSFVHLITSNYSAEEYHEILLLLLERNEETAFQIVNQAGQTPLHWAIYNVELSPHTMQLLCSKIIKPNIVDVNFTCAKGKSFLFYAVEGRRSTEILKTLIEIGVDTTIADVEGYTFAHQLGIWLGSEQYHEVVQLLFDEGREKLFQAVNDYEETPLHWAVHLIELRESTFELIRCNIFQKNIVSVNALDGEKCSFLCRAAIGKRSTRLLELLMDAGVNVFSEDLEGNTFAHYISKYYSAEQFHEIVELLLAKGHENVFQVQNIFQVTPFACAILDMEVAEQTMHLLNDRIFKTNKADINAVDEDGNSFLILAASERRSVKLLEMLMDMGVDVAIQNKERNTFGHFITQYYTAAQYHSILMTLVERGQEKLFSITNEHGATPLHWAAINLELLDSTVELLNSKIIQANIVHVNCVDFDGQSMLAHAALGKRSVKFLKMLMEIGVNVKIQNKREKTFAHIIADFYTAEQYHSIIGLVVSKGYEDVFGVVDYQGATPLHYAVFKLELSTKTLELYATIYASLHGKPISSALDNERFKGFNSLDNYGDSVLHWAVRAKRSLDFIQNLITLGADWTAKNNHNAGLAHSAASYGCVELLKYFVKLGCDVNSVDNDGDSVLQYAVHDASENLYEVVKFLVEAGANKNHQNNAGKTAHVDAVEKGITQEEILDFLV